MKLLRMLKNKWTSLARNRRVYLLSSWLLIIVGIAGITTAAILYVKEPKPPKNINISLGKDNAKSVDVAQAPSSTRPSAAELNNADVPGPDPRFITIPAIGLKNIPVLDLGLTSSGAIATPDNIYETGWYDGSSRPGEPGAMFIYGHVSSWTSDGVFYNLKKLIAGDTITITTGAGNRYTYVVNALKIYPYNNVDMSQVLAPYNHLVPGLNLMTCTGQVISGTSEFNERLAVFSSLSN